MIAHRPRRRRSTQHRGRTHKETRTYGSAADVVVITPHAVIVVEVKGLKRRVGGLLKCPANSAWTMAGINGDPVHLADGDLNPLQQLDQETFDLKHWVGSAVPGGGFVDALLVIVEFEGLPITADPGVWRVGVDLVVGRTQLHDKLDKFARRPDPRWSVERVMALLATLGVDAVTPDMLIEQGFPEVVSPPVEKTRRGVRPSMPTQFWTTPEPGSGLTAARDKLDEKADELEVPATQSRFTAPPRQHRRPPAAAPSAEVAPAPAPRRKSRRSRIIAALAAVMVVAGALWSVLDYTRPWQNHESPAHQPTTSTQGEGEHLEPDAPSPVVEPEPAMEETPAPLPPPPPASVARNSKCPYLFQTNC